MNRIALRPATDADPDAPAGARERLKAHAARAARRRGLARLLFEEASRPPAGRPTRSAALPGS